MSEAKRDSNTVVSALAYNGTATDTIKLDPSTNRVLIQIYKTTAPVSPVVNSNSRDGNYQPAQMADDGSGNLIPLHIDNRNGYLAVDFLDEG